MAIPASSTISSYDADTKVNGPIEPANPTTDWQNPLLAQGLSDAAGMTNTCPRFVCLLTLAASTGALVIQDWRAVWQNVQNVPAPLAARTGTGVFTITVPTQVNDEYSESVGIINDIPVIFFSASATLSGSTFGFVNASASDNVITINTANTSGSPNDLAGANVVIVGYVSN